MVIAGERYAEALAASEEWVAQSGAMAVHAYDQRETLLGQGTVGLEFEEQAPDLDTLLVAVGGGGLIGGVAAWYGGRIKIVGVEPEAAPTLANALRAGRPVDSEAGGIAADSLAPKRVGELMFPIAQNYVSSVVLVPDRETAGGSSKSHTVEVATFRSDLGYSDGRHPDEVRLSLDPRRCCRGDTNPRQQSAWACWYAAATRLPWILREPSA